jgi:transposase
MARSTQMVKIREILKYYETGIPSFSGIGRAIGIDKNTVIKIIKAAQDMNLKYDDVKDANDDELYKLFYPNNVNIKYRKPEPDVEKIIRELGANKTLTIKMLWEEYKNENLDGLGYTQFRERIKSKINERDITIHIERKPGEKMYVDWTGDTMPILDRDTGEIIKAYLFVTCVGVSSLVFIKAYLNTKLESFINGNVSALNYYGASPIFSVPDNDRSAVTKACKYDPTINETYLDMANYYGITVFPARVRSPKDKGAVEKAVLDNAERNIINKFRHYQFFTIEELNDRIYEQLTEINKKPFQKEPNECRFSKFFKIDRPAMKDLPTEEYEYPIFKLSTVHIDSHIEINHKCYSVPYRYIGQKVDVKIGTSKLVVYYKNSEIAVHDIIKGDYKRYSTKTEHLPERKQAYLTKNKSDFLKWAISISPTVEKIINAIFDASVTEEYAYRPCLGIKRLYKTYGSTKFIDACEFAYNKNLKTYKYLKTILENNLNKSDDESETIIKHANIRGAKAYGLTGEAYD